MTNLNAQFDGPRLPAEMTSDDRAELAAATALVQLRIVWMDARRPGWRKHAHEGDVIVRHCPF